MSPELIALLASEGRRKMTPEEQEEQIISFAYGNAHTANSAVTWEGIREAARKIKEGMTTKRRP